MTSGPIPSPGSTMTLGRRLGIIPSPEISTVRSVFVDPRAPRAVIRLELGDFGFLSERHLDFIEPFEQRPAPCGVDLEWYLSAGGGEDDLLFEINHKGSAAGAFPGVRCLVAQLRDHIGRQDDRQ